MRLLSWVFVSLLIQCLIAASALVIFYGLGQALPAIVAAATVFVLLNLIFAKSMYRRVNEFLNLVEQALLHYRDGEFSIRLPQQKNRQLQMLVDGFNNASEKMHQNRVGLLQREFLLDHIFMTVSSALLLTDSRHRVVLCNPALYELFNQTVSMKGVVITDLLPNLSPALADALVQRQDVLFTLDGLDDEPQIWSLSCEFFSLLGQEHCLYHFKQMTRTLSRAEVDTWKKVIRVLSHELNNSLAPISSLSHSGLQIVERLTIPTAEAALLTKIFTTVSERTSHLNSFLSGYAQFARLPSPQLALFAWHDFIAGLQGIIHFNLREPLPLRAGYGDVSQLSQLLVNIIKNAQQSGSPADAIELEVIALGDWDKIIISDAGCGMSEEQLSQALLPFYTTKRDGTGLGLAICREITDAHGGRIKLANRQEGGLQVTVWLPTKA